ncbi:MULTISPECIES: TIR domain-containing protein [Bradyrhizobium]
MLDVPANGNADATPEAASQNPAQFAPRYWCFLSYSRADAKLATRLQKFLENYRLPGNLARQVTPPAGLSPIIRPVFRDLTDLAAAPQLSEALKEALRNSAKLVVLCSPNAAASEWVNDEIKYFQSLGRHADVYPLIIAGEANSKDPKTECLPAALRGRERIDEPFLVDLRQNDFKSGGLRLIAGLHHLSLDDLVRRHVLRQRKVIASAIALGFFLVAAGTLAMLRVAADNSYASILAEAKAHEASERFRTAEHVLDAVPLWVDRFASSSNRQTSSELKLKLSYQAGSEPLDPIQFEMPLDPGLASSLPFSGDGRRMATPEHITTIKQSPKNDWLGVFDRRSGKRVSRIFGQVNSTNIALNRDGTVLTTLTDNNLVFRSVATGDIVSKTATAEDDDGLTFAASDRDRLIYFGTNKDGPLQVFESTTGHILATVSSKKSSRVKRISTGEERESVKHLPVLFGNGELWFVNLDDGTQNVASLPDHATARDILWVSAAQDAVLIVTGKDTLALYRKGEPRPVVVSKPTMPDIGKAVVLSDHRFAVISSDDPKEIVFFDPVDQSETSRHKLSEEVTGLASLGGSRSVMAALASGATYLVFDGDDKEVELLGQRMPVSYAAKNEIGGLYALGTENGYYIIGQPDSGVILREGTIGQTPVLAIDIEPRARSVEIIGGDGRRKQVEMLAPRQLVSWLVSDFTTINPHGEDDKCRDLALSPQADTLAVRTKTGLGLYRSNGEFLSRFLYKTDGLEGEKPTFEFDPTGRWILFAYHGEPISVIEVATGLAAETHPQYPDKLSDVDPDSCPRSFDGALSWIDTTSLLLPTTTGGQRWRIASGQNGAPPTLTLEGEDPERAVSIEPQDFKTKFSAPAGDREVSKEPTEAPVLRRASNQETIAVLGQFQQYADYFTFSSDGTRLLIAAALSGNDDDARPNGGYALIDAKTGATIREHREYMVDPTRLEFQPHGKYLLAAPAGGADFEFEGVATRADLIEASSGELVADLTKGFGTSVKARKVGGYADHVFSSDGRLLYAVRQTGNIDVWSLN